tara:strand:+ start:568 stop:1089 length:522 start_codon:yes stop_codon:yes gene_type:complete
MEGLHKEKRKALESNRNNKGVIMFDRNKKYKDVPNEDEVFTRLDKYDSNEATNLKMLLGNLSFPFVCCTWEGVKHFNKLLNKYKIDIHKYEKHQDKKDFNKFEISNTLFNLVEKNQYKKRNLIKILRDKFPNINAGIIHRLLNKYLSLRVLEIDTKYKTKPFVIKGRYFVKQG